MPPSPYGRRPTRSTAALPAPLRWLLRLNPIQSWLVVMGVVVGLSLIGLRWLGLLVAVVWSAYALYTWFSPGIRRRLAALRRTRF